ncbi:Protein of unknown function [Blastococcus aurantiacus]|uniref:DUF559 domain-containing protein n=1 Tax=Blastococcus aurantiacus TaxID=1550231 RepID=A0A1G7JFA3_9ACTN|nr:DUF559 domain-containing protein [Blastococcus aurantiacus]SDF23563.1 Protein of unknown function [Blastococcus aurantiacus]
MYLRSLGLHGVFIGAHAVSEGVLTRHQLQNGPYLRVLHGVYADPSLARDHGLRCRAAALLMPASAVLAGRSAATLMGVPAPGYGDPVTVVVPPGTKWRGPGGVRVHTADVPTSDVLIDEEGIRHTCPRRTAWDVAALEPIGTAVGVLDAMVRMRLLDVGTLQQMQERPVAAWRSRRARRAFGLVDGRSESPPESWVRVACALGGLPAPVLQYEVVEDGAWLARVDLAWPEQRLIVEYDGEHHFEGLQIVKDDARLAALVAAGWRVIRLSAADLRHMDDVVSRIATALRTRPGAG